MRFSVLTVTLNAEKYLAETLASTAKQSFTDFEHLLWDGGSTDKTLEIASSFSHVKIIQGKDTGIADAMNKVAIRAQGDFLLHLHADDTLIDSTVLERVDTILKLHPHLEWLYGLVVINEGAKVRKASFVPFDRKRLFRYNLLSHPSTFYSKRLFSQVQGFDRNLKYAMDYDLWLRFSQLATPLALPSYFATFRAHAGSLSTREKRAVADEAYSVRNRYLSSLSKWRSYRTWKRRRRALEKNL